MKQFRIVFLLGLSLIFFYSCSKDNSYHGVTARANTWTFTESGNSFSGQIDSTIISNMGSYHGLVINGIASDGISVLTLGVIGIDTSNAKTYKGSQVGFIYTRGHELLYENDQNKGDFAITITHIDLHSINGSFSGNLIDSLGSETKILNGLFTATR
jgi:hypothetical protein